VDAASAGKTAATVSTIAVIGGAVALAGGVTLFITHPTGGAGASTTAIGPTVLAGGGGAFVARTF
jgi:hypothetical protein